MIVNKPKKKRKNSRYSVLYMIMFIMFGTILSKLLYLQVYKYDDYKEKADTSSMRFISEKAPRGNIYDSGGNVLATNTQTYVLTYMQTDESTKAFYNTMGKVFKVLNENGEKIQDDFILKVNSSGEFYFEFKANESSVKRAMELLFKRDRGLNEKIQSDLYKDQKSDLTDAQIDKINEKLLEISAEETFYKLIEQYKLYEMLLPEGYTTDEAEVLAAKYKDAKGKDILSELVKQYTLEDVRSYMVIKDAIKMQSFKGYKSVTIANNIQRDTSFIIYQKLSDLPGIDVSLEPVRFYPFRNLASSVLGYVSSISSSQEEIYELRGYDVSTDLIGISGIEAALEDQLKGSKGGKTIKVNSQGRQTEELFQLESYAGNNVYLTIDKNVQYAAEQALKDTIERIRVQDGQPSATRGGVVAIEVGTGRVIAMASYPDYDPNDFAIPGELSDEKYNLYFNPDLTNFGIQHIGKTNATKTLDDLFPLNDDGVREDKYDIYPKSIFNYATQGLIPPGSTFKPLTSIAGLMEGVITPYESMNDTGIWKNDELGLEAENFQKVANGITDVRKALQVSSNYFYYETGYRLYQAKGGNVEALDSLAKYAWKFGLGVEQGKNPSTGIELYELFGQTYNFTSWKNSIVNTPMYNLVSALEIGNYGGYYFVPFDISKVNDDSDDLKQLKSDLKEKITSTLNKVGTEEQVNDYAELKEYIIKDIEKIMNISKKYKENVFAYEGKNGVKVNIGDQAEIVADAITEYTISDKTTEITSAAQIVYDAIGQGMNNFTPLQIANYVATLASGGTRYKISIVDKVTTPTGEVIDEFKPEVIDQLNIPEEYLQAVKEGMYRVNTSPANGVAYQSFANFPIKVAGKTGTADFGTEEQYIEQGRRPYGNYISFAPLDEPKIAIFSTVYDGNKGSSDATIHKAIYEAYFKDQLLSLDSSYASKSESFQKYVVNAPRDNKENVTDTSTETTVEEKKQETTE